MANNSFKISNSFIPDWFRRLLGGKYYYRNRITGQKQAIWIDVADAWKVYCTIPQLNAVINKKAEMLSNVNLQLIDNDGNEVEMEKDLERFLEQPNPLQTFKEWISQLSIYEDLYANGFVYPLLGTSL